MHVKDKLQDTTNIIYTRGANLVNNLKKCSFPFSIERFRYGVQLRNTHVCNNV